MMQILSLSSAVAAGHVGNSGIVFALQRLGAEIVRVDTVRYSNHPGHGDFAGRAADGAELDALIAGLARHGALAACRAMLSGYLGTVAAGEAALAALGHVRAAGPDRLYCCDPVFGDDGPGLYVQPDIVAFLQNRALPAADIATPNGFEAERLTAIPIDGWDAARRAAAALAGGLRGAGPRVAVITTVPAGAGRIGMVAVAGARAWRLALPRLALRANGAGDLFAALFLFHLLNDKDAGAALSAAASALAGVVRRTVALDARELALIAAQDELAAPSRIYGAEPF
ncbi:MAG: pyridoxal kinase [Rhodospirillales bacterium]|nr:pyridoxal kinase [Rhodospirillales bacterium]